MGEQQTPPMRADETPAHHAFVLFGKNNYYLAHSAMFLVSEHAYQAIVSVSLDATAQQLVSSIQDGSQLILAYSMDAQLLDVLLRAPFQVGLYRDSLDPDNLIGEATVTPQRLLFYRPLSQSLPEYPNGLSYFVFGRGGETFMSHVINERPNFHHEVTIQCSSDAFDPQALEQGFVVYVCNGNSVDVLMRDGFYNSNPLQDPSYYVSANGQSTVLLNVFTNRFTYDNLNNGTS